MVFQRPVLGLSILMTNVKLFDFPQKYLAVLIYIISSPGHTVGTYLLYRIPTGKRRQDEDAKIMILRITKSGLRMVNHHLTCRRVCAFPFNCELCICLKKEKDERHNEEIPAPPRKHHYPHRRRAHTLSFNARYFTGELVRNASPPTCTTLAGKTEALESKEYHIADSYLTLGSGSRS